MTDKELIISYIVNYTGGIQKSLKELTFLIIIISVIIIWNQIKIKKMLKKMIKEKEEGENSAKDTK